MLRIFCITALIASALGCGRFGFDSTEVGPDASSQDATANSSDANQDAGALPLCPASALFCDGFEAGDLSGWELDVAGGTLEVTSVLVFGGLSSVRVATEAAGAVARLHRNHDVITSGNLYMRSYWYLPSSPISTGLVETSNEGDDSGIHHHLGFDGATPLILANDLSAGADAEIARDQWHCIETEVEISASGTARLLVAESQVAIVGPTDNLLTGGYNRLSIGAYFTDEGSAPFEAFIDEVVVSTTPIGCL